MEWYKRYEQDLKVVFGEAGRRIRSWNSPFEGQALRYLEGFDITRREVPTNYICFLLPFWMEPAAGQDRRLSRHLCLANIFGMMAFHLQDEAMDKPGTELHTVLPLSALLHEEFHGLYAEIFPAATDFWRFYKRYLFQWAEAVSGENEQDWFHQNPVRMGHKASLVKLAATGLLLNTGSKEHIPATEQAVDQTLVVLQMLDDWEDWEKDLEESSYNSLIALSRSKLGLPASQTLSKENIREALYTYGVLSGFAERAALWEPTVSQIRSLVPELYAFYYFLLDNLQQGASQIEAEKKLLEAGGLSYFLSKWEKKNEVK
ncbi:hypothetical protein AWM70_01280 [Paenibacillus yonginensis]|uniref:Polyprenyl synthetase n=1 Tax=Paenibacillus yonginensis TaxID=1462996 RepID=A0A1B1MW37_9BACL|nr:hypothetical protein [Paenibacillus yonginensis]ANS73384.1 hypothetical protein AWM70_01280 [Paenibacillus yonginensis]